MDEKLVIVRVSTKDHLSDIYLSRSFNLNWLTFLRFRPFFVLLSVVPNHFFQTDFNRGGVVK